MNKTKSLADVPSGRKYKVVGVEGGHRATHRLAVLGIRPGMHIEKVSSMIFRGPITVISGQRQVSLGHGLAAKVMVEVL